MEATVWSDNLLCPYCGRSINQGSCIEVDTEHVIGRRFVPKGYLNGEWNFIVNACKDCNSYKARLEDGLSAISCLSVLEDLKYPDEVVDDVQRKLGKRNADTGAMRGATHPETNRPIVDSVVRQTLHTFFSPLSLSFSYIGPPQAPASERELARLQIQGFYYLIANIDPECPDRSRASSERCLYLHGQYVHPLFVIRRSDWGNEAANELVARTVKWAPCFQTHTARGHFKALIRRAQGREKPPLFWALEWNQNVRVLGMIREPGIPDIVEEGLPALQYGELGEGLKSRREIPLADKDDMLFKWPDRELTNTKP